MNYTCVAEAGKSWPNCEAGASVFQFLPKEDMSCLTGSLLIERKYREA
jgi:hypothetical protein